MTLVKCVLLGVTLRKTIISHVLLCMNATISQLIYIFASFLIVLKLTDGKLLKSMKSRFFDKFLRNLLCFFIYFVDGLRLGIYPRQK